MGQGVHCSYQVPEDIRWDDALAKSLVEWAPYELGGLRPQVEGRIIHISGVPAVPLAETPEAIVERLVIGLARGFRDLTEQLIDSQQSTRARISGDMFDALIEAGDIVPAGPGDFAYRGRFLEAMQRLDALMLEYALSIGAVEEAYPTAVPTALLRRAGYLNSFPHHALLVAPVCFDAASVARVRAGDSVDVASDLLAPAVSVLAPTVCYHSFQARLDRSLQRDETITAVNPCHRHEPALSGHTLERLTTFRMREFVFFGTAESVVARLDACFDWFLGRLRAWDVSFKATTANDPFFANSSDSKRAFQTVLSLKREVRLPIPATGRWIAAASFNNHQASLVKAFRISGEGGGAMASACAGFGYERLLYALFCAFGADLNDWPVDLGGSHR